MRRCVFTLYFLFLLIGIAYMEPRDYRVVFVIQENSLSRLTATAPSGGSLVENRSFIEKADGFH